MKTAFDKNVNVGKFWFNVDFGFRVVRMVATDEGAAKLAADGKTVTKVGPVVGRVRTYE